MSKLPPPVTKNSSKKDLWDEIEALRNEVDQQQVVLNEHRDRKNEAEHKVTMLSYQLNIIRAVLQGKV